MLKRKIDDPELMLAERSERLAQRRNLKMARSAHAYVRGSTEKFYEWLDGSRTKVPHGPPVWICGDCHIGNLGPLADAKGHVAIQIRDLDQTVVANPAYDVLRLGLSLASAARGSDLPGVITARILEALVAGYTEALGNRNENRDQPKSIQRLLRRAVRRRWRHLAEERLDCTKPTIPLGKRFWPLLPEERSALKTLLADLSASKVFCGIKDIGTAPIELADASYWVKGCSSLGRLRFAVLLRVKTEDGSKLRLIDIKEAIRAAVPGSDKAAMPNDQGARVVSGARALSPSLGNRMVASRIKEKSVTLRELAPQDLKIELDRLKSDDAIALARYLAGVIGEAHGRQMTDKDRAAWSNSFSKHHSSKLEAPSWLWSSVVDLITIHESAYLEHCRRYALSQQK